jgi:gliding motility-associatede transport system auxiliary component
MKQRNALLTTNAIVSAALVAALLIALNYLGTVHHARWDLTATREHSLSPQTIRVLRSLPGPIQAVAFPNGDAASSYRQMMATYQYYSKNFQYRIVDPDRNPTEAQRYKVASYGQIVLNRGKASYTVDSDREEQLTNGLLHLMETTKKVVYALQGEGEVPLDDFTRNGMGNAKEALTSKGFDVKALFLVQTGRVPDDAAAVIVAAPTRELVAQARDAVERYYRSGGKLLILVDPQTPQDIRSWLGTTFQVDAPGGLVIDPVSRLMGGDFAVPIVTQYPYNDITQNFNLATAFPVSTPLVPNPKPAGVAITPVVKTSDASYAKTNLESKNVRFEPGDLKGPITLAVQVTPSPPASSASPTPAPPAAKPGTPAAAAVGTKAGGAASPAPKGAAVIFGNSGFVRNSYIGLVGNRDLFTSAVAWLTQSGNLVSIAPRSSPFDPFIVGGSQARYLFLGSVIVLPLALLVIGGSVYFRRRSL